MPLIKAILFDSGIRWHRWLDVHDSTSSPQEVSMSLDWTEFSTVEIIRPVLVLATKTSDSPADSRICRQLFEVHKRVFLLVTDLHVSVYSFFEPRPLRVTQASACVHSLCVHVWCWLHDHTHRLNEQLFFNRGRRDLKSSIVYE